MELSIIVNQQRRLVPEGDIGFADIIQLAGIPADQARLITVLYRSGRSYGNLAHGCTVPGNDDMEFTAGVMDEA